MKMISLRVEDEVYEDWKKQAGKEGLSKWIREKCGVVPTRATLDNPSAIQNNKPPITLPNPKVCVNCEHAQSKHCGYNSACQENTCLCRGFE